MVQCLHPHCPMGGGAENWDSALEQARIQGAERDVLLQALHALGPPGEHAAAGLEARPAVVQRLLDRCPCLYTQVGTRISARAVVHLCEITLGARVDSSNVQTAFEIQDPNNHTKDFAIPPRQPGAKGGDIMEYLCGEVLTSAGVPAMDLDQRGWPRWRWPGHVSLNHGRLARLKMYGDILIPAAPHNLLVSVKTQKARERLMLSGNRLESVGFGFFDSPAEFWTANRINMYKRMGFTAIYMPADTVQRIMDRLHENDTIDVAININGKPLYRPLRDFGRDMLGVAGRITLDL